MQNFYQGGRPNYLQYFCNRLYTTVSIFRAVLPCNKSFEVESITWPTSRKENAREKSPLSQRRQSRNKPCYSQKYCSTYEVLKPLWHAVGRNRISLWTTAGADNQLDNIELEWGLGCDSRELLFNLNDRDADIKLDFLQMPEAHGWDLAIYDARLGPGGYCWQSEHLASVLTSLVARYSFVGLDLSSEVIVEYGILPSLAYGTPEGYLEVTDESSRKCDLVAARPD